MKSIHLLKEYVSSILKEEEGRLSQEQIKITCHLVMDSDAHVPDTMTRIRGIGICDSSRTNSHLLIEQAREILF